MDSRIDETLTAGADSTNTISVVQRLDGDDAGFVAEIARTDIASGDTGTELIRGAPDGRTIATLRLSDTPGELEARIAAAFWSDPAPAALVPGDGLLPLSPKLKEALETWPDDAVTAPVATASSARWCVLQAAPAAGGTELAAVNLTRRAAPRRLDTTPLALGGWRRLSALHVAESTLYAAVADPVAGFDLFACDLAKAKSGFSAVMTRGAHRFAVNGAIAALCPMPGGLLAGTAALAGGAEQIGDWGPELFLITPDGKWDLIVGQPRFSPGGLILPASALMPGLGDPANAAIKAIARGAGRTVIAVQGFSGDPVEDRRETAADLFDYQGAVRFFASPDLSRWEEIRHDLPPDTGAVTGLGITGHGLFVGHEGLGAGTVPISHIPLP